MKTAVSRLAERGMAVFPVKPNKHPLTQHGCLDGTKDQAFINSWWTKWPTANIAIATGKPSRIFVLSRLLKDRRSCGSSYRCSRQSPARPIKGLRNRRYWDWARWPPFPAVGLMKGGGASS